jgi:hypothetical protein
MPLKDYNFKGYVIRLTEDALLQASLGALEAYAIYHKGLPKRRAKYAVWRPMEASGVGS